MASAGTPRTPASGPAGTPGTPSGAAETPRPPRDGVSESSPEAPLSESVGAPLSESPVSRVRHLRAYVRAFCATNYLLGKRGRSLLDGLPVEEPQLREFSLEVMEQFSHGLQAQRARVLAAEVGRLMRSLSTQKLK